MVAVVLICAQGVWGADSVTFSGKLENVACTMVCGTCCTETLLSEKNNGFQTPIMGSEVNLSAFMDDGQYYRVSGYFFQGRGSCDIGECTYFKVESIEPGMPETATLDLTTGNLTIPKLTAEGFGNYELELAPPYNPRRLRSLADVTPVEQGGDCSDSRAVCAAGFTCVSYYGIGGPSGPLFQTCEVPCTTDDDCPPEQTCVRIADGPGDVCQPVLE